MPTFDDFLQGFFAIFTQRQFRNSDFLTYIQRPAPRRSGDEASIVDNAIVSPLLALLGFAPGEQVYNQNNKNGRPDFAPTTDVFGICFVVEDKSTGIELELNTTDPGSHLSQLWSYLRSLGLRTGWLTNGRRLAIWRLDGAEQPTCTLDLDIPASVQEWESTGQAGLSSTTNHALHFLWEQFRKETYADLQRLEKDMATDLVDWLGEALPVGGNVANQSHLVGSVKTLLQDLQADARRQLDEHLTRNAEYVRRVTHVEEDDTEEAPERMERLRNKALVELGRLAPLIGLTQDEVDALRGSLLDLERDPFTYLNTKELLAKTLATVNAARERKLSDDKKSLRAWSKYDNGLGGLGDALTAYGDTAFAWHKRKGFLRHDYRESIDVGENYAIWTAIVQETMLGGLDENQRRDEFALQAAYVVFIRLMLIRVCEDKGILRSRLLSDGGLKHWQEDIGRYFLFATGNPYEPLLDMAYNNAQNIYAHFFTGRELFNWYSLSRLRFVRVLYQLNRYNFAEVDSDLIGTIYNTYVERPEKKHKGQYYTPPEIVRYILDESEYVTGPGIIGPNTRLIDPACGSGSFLVEAARRLTASYSATGGTPPRQLIDRVRDNLYGFDLNPFACYLAEVNLLIQVLDLVKLALDGKTPPNLQRFHIYNVDALAPSSGVLYFARSNTLMAEEMEVVDRIKGRQGEYQTGFGWVVANPPYGAALTDSYKLSLRSWWPLVFYGKPDTYVFFFALALRLLGANGRLGFITPNTYLMGTNTANLRNELLTAGRITQIVDLPSGIWKDANVDCALLFLVLDGEEERRKANQTQVFSMAVRDSLDKLTARAWHEKLTQAQAIWIEDSRHEMNIRWTPLLRQIEDACRVGGTEGQAKRIQRLGSIARSNRGLEPYHSRTQGESGVFVKVQRALAPEERHWKPLLDSSSSIGRFELRWSNDHPHVNYGNWLYRAYDPIFFDSPKLLFIRLRNRALRRRLVATFDDSQFYNRHNFSNIISQDPAYNLKYILALFNSSVLNYWYARQYPDVEISIVDTRRLPIYPADEATQAGLVELVDGLLTKHAKLNELREQDYTIRTRRDGTYEIVIPYDVLLDKMQSTDVGFPVYSLFDARAAGLITLPDQCDPTAQISRVYTASKRPNSVVLRANQLWLDTDDPDIRRYLLNYLARPRWKGRSWDEISSDAVLPAPPMALASLFAEEERIVAGIKATLDAIAAADAEIDNRVLDLYGIIDPADRARVLGSAPILEDAEMEDSLDSGSLVASDVETAPEVGLE